MVLGELIGRGVVFVSTWASECVCVCMYLCDCVCVCTEIKSERDGQQLHRKSTYECWGGEGLIVVIQCLRRELTEGRS